jgi:hypothetical protein
MANPGSKYIALTNLSRPRKNRKPDDPNDLVPAGETVVMTAEEAAMYLPPNKPVPMVAKIGDSAGAALLLPRQMSGRMRQPPSNPPKGYDGPRRDPAGSTHILVMEEATDGADHLPEGEHAAAFTEGVVDALDIPPSGQARVGALT